MEKIGYKKTQRRLSLFRDENNNNNIFNRKQFECQFPFAEKWLSDELMFHIICIIIFRVETFVVTLKRSIL